MYIVFDIEDYNFHSQSLSSFVWVALHSLGIVKVFRAVGWPV